MILKGTFTAMITPFLGDELDEEGLVQNIQRQLDAGVSGLVFLGTTGEPATLTEEEQKKVISIGVKEAKNRALVLIGTGSYSTRQAIERTKKAKDLGADAAMVVTPYYNKPSQEGIYRHFEAIATSVDLPILVYNHQGRTGTNIEPETLAKIAKLPQILGVKEAANHFGQIADVIHLMRHKPSFSVLSPDDALTIPTISLGGAGVVSVLSNLVPEKVVALVDAALQSNFIEARKIQEDLYPLMKLAFIETNPVPIKEMMHLCGMPAGPCRLPLCELKPENRKQIEAFLRPCVPLHGSLQPFA